MAENPLMNEQLPPGLTRDALLEMARAAGLQRAHPGMAPELIAFAVELSRFEREQCQRVCRSMSFEFNAGSREQDVLQRVATRLDMPQFRA